MRMISPGVFRLNVGECYSTPGRGTVIWECMCISVFERAVPEFMEGNTAKCYRLQRHNWRIRGEPPQVEDSTGHVHAFGRENALFTLFDGTRLLVSQSSCGSLSELRIYEPEIPINPGNLGDIDARCTMVFTNRGFEKTPLCDLQCFIEEYGNP